MTDIQFFDINGIIGAPVFNPDSGLYSRYGTEEDLLESMDHYGVNYSLISHFRCRAGQIGEGNLEVSRLSRIEKRFYSAWYILPFLEGDDFSLKEIRKEFSAREVKAVRVPLGGYNVTPALWYLEDILEIVEDEGIPCILELPTLGVAVPDRDDYYMEALIDAASRFKDLPIVSGGRLRGFYKVMEKCPNIYFSMEWDPHPGIVEDIVRRFGSERCIFGTPCSENAKGISSMNMALITMADISDEDKKRIAGGNLADLLGVKLKADEHVKASEAADPRRDNTSSIKVFDVHVHVQPFSWEFKPFTDAGSLLKIMKKAGIEKACINGTEAILGGNTYLADDKARENAEEESSFLWFSVINPWFEKNDLYIKECVEKKDCMGIKIHPRTHNCDINDDKYNPVWEASEKYGIPVLSHTGEGQAHSDPAQFEEIAAKFPRGRFILGHTGETFQGMNTCINLVNRFNNLWVEISGWCFLKKGYLEYLVNRVPVEKIIFGSDYGWIDPRAMVGVVLGSDIPQDVKKKIFWENAKALWEGSAYGPFKE